MTLAILAALVPIRAARPERARLDAYYAFDTLKSDELETF